MVSGGALQTAQRRAATPGRSKANSVSCIHLHVLQWLAKGVVSCHNSNPCRVFPLDGMVAAHEYAERGHVRGKVGIEIKKLQE